jgi:hypothetical protein
MVNSKAERKAMHAVAQAFIGFNWFFRECPGPDFGIDAYVETGHDKRPSGKHIALQIKGCF